MIRIPLTIEMDRGGKSTLARILEAMDSPFVFYMVFVLPFMLIALLFRTARAYAWTFGESGITIRMGKIVTQRIRPENIVGIDAVDESSAAFLCVKWWKKESGPVYEARFPGSRVDVPGMSTADVARELDGLYRGPR